jgi:hypothetical protein
METRNQRIPAAGSPSSPVPFNNALKKLVTSAAFRKQVLAHPPVLLTTFPDLDLRQISVLVQVGTAAGFNIPNTSASNTYCCCCCCGFPGMPTKF